VKGKKLYISIIVVVLQKGENPDGFYRKKGEKGLHRNPRLLIESVINYKRGKREILRGLGFQYLPLKLDGGCSTSQACEH